MAQFNKALKPFVRKLVEDRKKSILTARNIAQSLGYPMVRVGHTPVTHVPAQVRRMIFLRMDFRRAEFGRLRPAGQFANAAADWLVSRKRGQHRKRSGQQRKDGAIGPF